MNTCNKVHPTKRRSSSQACHHKGHNQHSLLSVGLTVWKSSLNDECNCVPDFVLPSRASEGIASRYADDGVIYCLARPLASSTQRRGRRANWQRAHIGSRSPELEGWFFMGIVHRRGQGGCWISQIWMCLNAWKYCDWWRKYLLYVNCL